MSDPTEQETYRKSVDERFDNQDTVLGQILAQTIKTNGRVNKLERWQSYVLGFCAALSLIFISILIPIFTAYIQARRI